MQVIIFTAPAKNRKIPVIFEIAPKAERGKEQKLPPAIKAKIPKIKYTHQNLLPLSIFFAMINSFQFDFLCLIIL